MAYFLLCFAGVALIWWALEIKGWYAILPFLAGVGLIVEGWILSLIALMGEPL